MSRIKLMTFKYKRVRYLVKPYIYKVIFKDGSFYIGIKFSKNSANPILFFENYFTSSKKVLNNLGEVDSFLILKTFKVSKYNYVATVKYLKELESRYIQFYNLINNKKCYNQNYIKDNHVICSSKDYLHLLEDDFKRQTSIRMQNSNPMFDDDIKLANRDYQRDLVKRGKHWTSSKSFSTAVKNGMKKGNQRFISEDEKYLNSQRMLINNPMFNEESKHKMVLTKMYNVLKKQEILFNLYGIQPKDWDDNISKIKSKHPEKKQFFKYASYKKWVNNREN